MALPALLSTDDLVKFRTRFCERFLQFGECNFGGKCQYSHNMTWRRRSPQKYLYEPRLCENIVWLVGENGLRRQTVSNCHNGKNCKFAHSREEILYHPLIYKTVMCEDITCGKFYCPFAHSMEELLPAAESPDYIRRCLLDASSIDESDSDLLDDGGEQGMLGDGEITLLDSCLRLRKASGQGLGSPQTRLHLPVPGSAEWNSDPSAWISISAAIRIETVIRARSTVVPSELCRALVSRTDTAGLAAKKITPSGGGLPTQYCLAKVIQIPGNSAAATQLIGELQTISKTEHRNLVNIKRVHVGTMPSGGQMICLALEQASSSLSQAIADGYRADGTVRGLARKLNPHTGVTTLTASQKISDVVAGLQRLHFIGSAHGRLSPSNILIDAEASFKISDFMGKMGILYAKENPEWAKPYLEESALIWQAPELSAYLRNPMGSMLPDLKKCDVYSLGCVVFFAMTGQHPFGGFEDNMLADYVSNQHLLYSCPLVLDLCLRCLVMDPSSRIDLSELSRHPLFWDFDTIRNTLTGPLDLEGSFLAQYELKWREMTVGWLNNTLDEESAEIVSQDADKFPDTVSGAIQFLVDVWNGARTSLSVVSSVWIRVLDAFPQILIRVWDSQRLKSSDLLQRNHLHWMSLRSCATTCVSHQFVREYYDVIHSKSDCGNFIADESAGLSDACAVQVSGFAKARAPRIPRTSQYVLAERKFSGSVFGSAKLRPQPSPVITPSPPQGNTPVAGMTFVDPMIVKQMAAASAALSAIYDNPELVTAITKGDATPYNQLVATASIYSSLLEDPSSRPAW